MSTWNKLIVQLLLLMMIQICMVQSLPIDDLIVSLPFVLIDDDDNANENDVGIVDDQQQQQYSDTQQQQQHDQRMKPKFQQYSGYINATYPQYGCCGCTQRPSSTSSTTTQNQQYPEICQMHYWFIIEEEEDIEDDMNMSTTTNNNNNTNSKPIILWFNGGPGASSIIGLLHEFGPYLITTTTTTNKSTTTYTSTRITTTGSTSNSSHDDNIPNELPQLILNPYRWTKFANILIIESPVGVGYSYCSNNIIQNTSSSFCINTDNTTAQMILYGLLDFYSIYKFQEYIHNDLYIIGESYAGVYIPTITYEILLYNNQQNQQQQVNTIQNIPLVGIAVGDPCTDINSQSQSMDPLWYGHTNGLIDDAIYTTIINDPTCKEYYMYMQQQQQETLLPIQPLNLTITNDCRLAYRKYLLSTSRGLSAYKHWNHSYIDRYNLYGFIDHDNTLNTMTELYMNHPLVRNALHIPNFVYQNDTNYWKVHSTSNTMKYIKQYNACNHEQYYYSNNSLPTTLSMIDLYRVIVPQLQYGAIVYNGNTDPAIPYEGTRTAIKNIGYLEIDGGSYRPWFYNHTTTSKQFIKQKFMNYGPNIIVQSNVGIQLGGYIINYENNLIFLIIHGSGHLVPQIRPQISYHFISKFVNHSFIQSSNHDDVQSEPESYLYLLSPLLPSNESLINMNYTNQYDPSSLFVQALNNWTILAKSYHYVH